MSEVQKELNEKPEHTEYYKVAGEWMRLDIFPWGHRNTRVAGPPVDFGEESLEAKNGKG